jgi:hypothetical protein
MTSMFSGVLARKAVTLLAMWVAGGTSAGHADERFLSEEGRFRIAFPAPPNEEASGRGGQHHRARVVIDGVTYFVDWADLSPDAIRKAGQADILLHRLRDGLAEGKTVITEAGRSIGGSPGIELVLGDGAGGRRIYHIYKVGPRLYTVGVVGKTERLRTQQQQLERFIDSFSVLTVPPRKLGPLAVKVAEPRYGKLGPPRPDWRFLPYDVLTARLSLVGFATDDEGHFDLEATTEVVAADGEVVSKEPYRLRGVAIDPIMPLDILQQLPVKEGEYRLRVSLHDVRSGERTAWEQPFTREPAKPALVAAALYRDADAKVPSPAFARVGDTLFLEVRFIGFDRSRDRIDTALEVQVLDEQGQPMLESPSTAAIATADRTVVRNNEVVTFMVAVPCPRVTKATVRATATDKAGGTTATLELPLEIHEPT